jgi:signal transduction histidine kinase
VAVEVQSEGNWRTLAAHGSRVGPVRTIPLVVQGEIVGHLQLGVEHEEDGWAPGTPRLLEDLIRQVSIAVQAVHLIEALRRSREKLVNAREEERRRLRRDLHDGLGSGLASMRLRLDLAVMMMENEPAKAQGLMHEVQAQLVESIADIRRLVYALRPPALDEFGLVFALKELAMQYEGLDVIVEAPRGHLTLYAGAEVAIYRIVQEAVNNTSKHAFATTCRVRLSVGEEIELEIADDGQGMPERIQAGVGLHSMKERAEELGGKYDIQSTAGQGTVVRVRLPMEREDEGDGNQRERHPAGVAGR